MSVLILVAATGLSVAPPAASPIVVTATRRVLLGAIVSDGELASMRGGVRLPNGLSVTIGIDIQTRINGLLALHTVYASEGATPGIRVYTDGARPVPLAPTTQTIMAPGVASIPQVTVDRSPSGTTIVPTSATSATTVNLVNGDPSTWLSGAGQTQLPVVNNGPPVATADGNVTLREDNGNSIVRLQSDTLDVRQLIGQATGVVVANTADGRTIDTVSSVNVDVQGLTPAFTSGLFAAQRMAVESTVLSGH